MSFHDKIKGKTVPKYPTGPDCEGCSYRATSIGYVPASGDTGDVLWLLEAPGPHEVIEGRNAVGPTGKLFNKLVRESGLLRADGIVANTIRCRPVEWTTDSEGNQIPATLEYNGDYVTAKPTPGQIRECASRYTDKMIENFKGHTIVGLGKVPLQYMTESNKPISDFRGTIFEAGELVDCTACLGIGSLGFKYKKCMLCAGKGLQRCIQCQKWKPTKKCPHSELPACVECEGSGQVKGKIIYCKNCENGRVPKNPDNVYICEKLKPGQIFFPSYHPAFLMRQPGMWPAVMRDFRRIPHLHDEIRAQETLQSYIFYPDPKDRHFLEGTEFSLDIEGPDARTYQGEITVVGVSNAVGQAVALDPQDPRFCEAIEKGTVVGQNYLEYDAWVLDRRGYPRFKRLWDTRFAGHLLNPDTPNDLTYLAAEFAVPPVRGYWKTRQNYSENIETVVCMDVDVTKRVKDGEYEALKNNGQLHIMENDIIPLCNVVFDMRKQGVRVDLPRMSEARTRIQAELDRERHLLPEYWGPRRSENQHARIQEHLFGVLGLRPHRSKDTGHLTADKAELQRLMDESEEYAVIEFITRLQRLKKISKLSATFLSHQQEWLHPVLKLAGTATLRLSCANPNLQQIPKCRCAPACFGLNPECRGARHIFLPDDEDSSLVAVDLSQAEVIGLLWYAEEFEILRKALFGGFDVHSLMAERVRLSRDDTKITTFAIIYGEAPKTTASRLGRPLDEIKGIRANYLAALPGVESYREAMISHSRRYGYVVSPFDVRRYIRVESPHGTAANQACNAPLQNIPPMITRRAMRLLASQLPKPARLWMQVHDEVIVSTPNELLPLVCAAVRDIITSAVPEMPAAPLGMAGGLKFNASLKAGPNWGAMKGVA